MGGYLAYTEYKDSGIEWLGKIPSHWSTSKLKFISNIVDCKNRTPEYFPDGDCLVVRTTNVRDGNLVLTNAFYTNEENHTEWTRRGVPPSGSILFTREAPAGEVCLVPTGVKLCLGQRMMNFIPYSKWVNSFILYFLRSQYLSDFINAESWGSTVTHLRVEQVYNINIVVLPLLEQRSIARFLDYKTTQIDALIAKKETLLKKLAEKRTALISQAVTKGCDRAVPMKDSGVEWLGEIPVHWIVSKRMFRK